MYLGQYLELVLDDATGAELLKMLDALSTNLTRFYREPEHFDYLRGTVLPALLKRPAPQRLRLWSAGCSTGEEAYTLAMTVCEAVLDPSRADVRILATDLSTQVLAKARHGIYPAERLRDVPPSLMQRHFIRTHNAHGDHYQATDALRGLITFSRLNLMEPWPMQGPFDVIFCRNVMIYFDKPTQDPLVARYWSILRDGGYLFIGHSESLAGIRHRFHYVKPTVYLK